MVLQKSGLGSRCSVQVEDDGLDKDFSCTLRSDSLENFGFAATDPSTASTVAVHRMFCKVDVDDLPIYFKDGHTKQTFLLPRMASSEKFAMLVRSGILNDASSFIRSHKFLSQLNPRTFMACLPVPSDCNSLFHAVSAAMHGIIDTDLLLKHAVIETLQDDSKAALIIARTSRDEQATRQQAHARWRSSDCISQLENGKETTPYALYVLSQVIMRPILVYSWSETSEVAGFYLPFCWPSHIRSQDPVVLVERDGQYEPLVRDALGEGEIERFPLYSMGGTLLQVQFACKEDIQGEWLKYFIPEMTHIAGSDVLCCKRKAELPGREIMHLVETCITACEAAASSVGRESVYFREFQRAFKDKHGQTVLASAFTSAMAQAMVKEKQRWCTKPAERLPKQDNEPPRRHSRSARPSLSGVDLFQEISSGVAEAVNDVGDEIEEVGAFDLVGQGVSDEVYEAASGANAGPRAGLQDQCRFSLEQARNVAFGDPIHSIREFEKEDADYDLSSAASNSSGEEEAMPVKFRGLIGGGKGKLGAIDKRTTRGLGKAPGSPTIQARRKPSVGGSPPGLRRRNSVERTASTERSNSIGRGVSGDRRSRAEGSLMMRVAAGDDRQSRSPTRQSSGSIDSPAAKSNRGSVSSDNKIGGRPRRGPDGDTQHGKERCESLDSAATTETADGSPNTVGANENRAGGPGAGTRGASGGQLGSPLGTYVGYRQFKGSFRAGAGSGVPGGNFSRRAVQNAPIITLGSPLSAVTPSANYSSRSQQGPTWSSAPGSDQIDQLHKMKAQLQAQLERAMAGQSPGGSVQGGGSQYYDNGAGIPELSLPRSRSTSQAASSPLTQSLHGDSPAGSVMRPHMNGMPGCPYPSSAAGGHPMAMAAGVAPYPVGAVHMRQASAGYGFAGRPGHHNWWRSPSSEHTPPRGHGMEADAGTPQHFTGRRGSIDSDGKARGIRIGGRRPSNAGHEVSEEVPHANGMSSVLSNRYSPESVSSHGHSRSPDRGRRGSIDGKARGIRIGGRRPSNAGHEVSEEVPHANGMSSVLSNRYSPERVSSHGHSRSPDRGRRGSIDGKARGIRIGGRRPSMTSEASSENTGNRVSPSVNSSISTGCSPMGAIHLPEAAAGYAMGAMHMPQAAAGHAFAGGPGHHEWLGHGMEAQAPPQHYRGRRGSIDGKARGIKIGGRRASISQEALAADEGSYADGVPPSVPASVVSMGYSPMGAKRAAGHSQSPDRGRRGSVSGKAGIRIGGRRASIVSDASSGSARAQSPVSYASRTPSPDRSVSTSPQGWAWSGGGAPPPQHYGGRRRGSVSGNRRGLVIGGRRSSIAAEQD